MKTWTRDEIDALLATNVGAVETAILRLYALQTADEQASHDTRHRNHRGFSSSHAKSGSYWANVIMNNTNPFGRRIWGKALEKCRKIALKHSRQLVLLANAKEQEKAVAAT